MSATTRVLAEVARRRGIAQRLADGSAVLVRRYARQLEGWVRKGRRDDLDGVAAALGPIVRLLLLLGAAWVAYRVLRALPWALWLLAAGWCVAAYRATPTTPRAAPAEGVSAEPVRVLLSGLIGEGRGVHLSTVLAHLQERGQGVGWEVADLRARLDAAGVPVRRSLKVAGRVAYGVHRDDLPAPPPPQDRGVDGDPSTSL